MQIDYFVSLNSLYTHVVAGRVEAVAERYGVGLRIFPVDFGAIFAATGGLALPKRSPQRQAYRRQELRRWRDHLGIAINLALGAEERWAAERRRDTETAIARGVFGAPSYVVGDEIFWGQDRLDSGSAVWPAAECRTGATSSASPVTLPLLHGNVRPALLEPRCSAEESMFAAFAALATMRRPHMRVPIAAALALAAGLMAAPGYARTTNSPVGKVQTSTTSTNAAGTMRASSSHHRMTSRHHGTHMHMAAANPTAAEHARVEQLNNMSLQSAKRGQSLAAPTGGPAGQQ